MSRYLRESCQTLGFDILSHKELIAYTCVSVLREGLTLLDPGISLITHLNRVAKGIYALLPYAIDFWTQHVQEVASDQQPHLPSRLAVELSRLDSQHKQLRFMLPHSSLEASIVYRQTDHPSVNVSIYTLFSSFQKNHNVSSTTNGEGKQLPCGHTTPHC